MFPHLSSQLIRAHGSPLLRRRSNIRRHPPPPLFHRRSHSLPPQNAGHPDPRLGFVRGELEELQSLIPTTPQRSEREQIFERRGERRVEISHPWPEWLELMDRLIIRGYMDRNAFQGSPPLSSLNASKDSNHTRTACLNFARDRFDLIRYFSRRDIRIVVGAGCPSLDRKVVNSGKRLRAYVGVEEGDVCSSCDLRGGCERAYVKARDDEGGRTVDVMRILLTYGLDVIIGTVENQACTTKAVKGSVRKLLNEMLEFDHKEVSGTSTDHRMPNGQISVPMKQGDWTCPKCSFLNFARNIKCLRCNGVFQERFKKLREDAENLPLKKGDWICEKCNFLNFAKNTKCLQCHEKPPKRQLNAGEWECVSCNYINFRRNMVCLKCDWKRPKASNTEITESKHDEQGHHSHPSTIVTHNSGNADRLRFVRDDSLPSQEEDTDDFWSSGEDRASDGDPESMHKYDEFDEFPIVGGKGATSRNPIARESWKEKMLRIQGGASKKGNEENNGGLSFAGFCRAEIDESGDEDDISGWFRHKSEDVR